MVMSMKMNEMRMQMTVTTMALTTVTTPAMHTIGRSAGGGWEGVSASAVRGGHSIQRALRHHRRQARTDRDQCLGRHGQGKRVGLHVHWLSHEQRDRTALALGPPSRMIMVMSMKMNEVRMQMTIAMKAMTMTVTTTRIMMMMTPAVHTIGRSAGRLGRRQRMSR